MANDDDNDDDDESFIDLQSDGYEEDESALSTQSSTTSSLFGQTKPTSSNHLESSSLSQLFTPTQLQLVDLKVDCSLSSTVMDKFINFCRKGKMQNLPPSYDSIETKLLIDHCPIETAWISGVNMCFIPLHRWLPLLVQLNLLLFLVTTPSAAPLVGDISTGNWFKRFLGRCPADRIPLAVDIYYDHWKVSDSSKIGGLYMSIANTTPHFLMQPENKFVLALLPEKVDLQMVLLAVLNDFIAHEGLFDVTLHGVNYSFYIEIARLVGDIPGLAELCCVLNHRALSPCRKCKILSEFLLLFDAYPNKSQAEITSVLETNMPKLAVHGQKGLARKALQGAGLKAKLPVWLQIPASMAFDLTTHSVTCLLHNEDLGLMIAEISNFVDLLSTDQKSILCARLLNMPAVSGLPRFKAIFLEKPHSLLGKEVICITKYILYAAYGLCDEDEDLLPYWELLHEHIIYFRMLAHPHLALLLISDVQNRVIAHHKQYVMYYLTDDDGDVVSQIVNPHQGMHWEEDMLEWGLPLYFSTNHWEPKHKVLKRHKERQTNNTNHSKDVLIRDWVAQVNRTTGYLHIPTLQAARKHNELFPTEVIRVSHSVTKQQTVFVSQFMTDDDKTQTCNLLFQTVHLWRGDVYQLKHAYSNGYKYKADVDVQIYGGDNQFWFGRIIYLFSYEILNQVSKVFCKISWYQPLKYTFGASLQHQHTTTVLQDSAAQFDFIAARILGSTDIIDLNTIYHPILVLPLNSVVVGNNHDDIYLLDCCYYVNKMYDELEDNHE